MRLSACGIFALLGLTGPASAGAAEFSPPSVLLDIFPGDSSYPKHFCEIDSGIVFVASHPQFPEAIWFTDGSSEGTRIVLTPEGQPTPSELGVANCEEVRRHAFVSTVSANGKLNILAVDGSSPPEIVLPNVEHLPSLFNAGATAELGQGRTVFLLESPGLGTEPWVTDGTTEGTRLLADTHPGPGNVFQRLIAADTLAYAIHQRGDLRFQAWSTDGTTEGTRPVGSPFGGPETSILAMAALGSSVVVPLFVTPEMTTKLLRLDSSGQVTEIASIPSGLNPAFSASIATQGRIYFAAAATGEGDLWVTDGTAAGTRFLVGGVANASYQLFGLGPNILFVRSTFENGTEVWTSDGTVDGTHLFLDICPGNCSSSPTLTKSTLGVLVTGYRKTGEFVTWWIDSLLDAALPLVNLCASDCAFPPFIVNEVSNRVIFAAGTGDLSMDLWSLNPASRALEQLTDFNPYWWGDGPFVARTNSSLVFPVIHASTGNEPWHVRRQDLLCDSAVDLLCLRSQRFRVSARWRDFVGREGLGRAISLTSDTGYFWFFNGANVELMLKIVDGTDYNGFFWVYYGALSNVEYWITVEDTVTRKSRTYHNPLGTFGSFGDIEALPAEDSGAILGEVSTALTRLQDLSADAIEMGTTTCFPSATRVCLLGGRFAVEASWTDFAGNSGAAYAEQLTSDTGNLWFFDPDVVEIAVKLVDGSEFNDHIWVYYGSLSNVEFTLTVTDTMTGEPRPYFNPLGEFGSFGDILAFPAH